MKSHQIIEKAKQFAQYDMIQTYAALPNFPSQRTHLLYTFLNKCSQVKHSELYALVTLLAQMGMDTHDNIETGRREKTSFGTMNRTKQLSVLAGDYFSGRFYQLLAQAGQIETIKRLSDAICEVNQAKLNLYGKMKHLKCTAEEFLKQTVWIKTQLFLSFNHWFDPKHRAVWNDIFSVFTRCEVIAAEIQRGEHFTCSRESWAYCFILEHASEEDKQSVLNRDKLDRKHVAVVFDKYRIGQALRDLLTHNVLQLQTMIEQHTTGSLAQELNMLLKSFMYLMTPAKVAEESS